MNLRRLMFFLTINMIIGVPSIIAQKYELLEMTKTSDIIITGKIINVVPRIDNENGIETINTFITIKVEEQLKGNSNNQNVVIKTEGGVIGNRTVWCDNSLPFTKEEEVLLFLRYDNGKDKPLILNTLGAKLKKIKVNDNCSYDISSVFCYDDPKTLKENIANESLILTKVKGYIKNGIGGK